jgi:2-oxoglutarate dehydrogenase E2 component (dihydrolipoamide succinyltransferase)
MAQYELLLPKMGESVAEATVIKWLKQPGDMISLDDTLLEIATDKVDSEVPSPVAGKLISQLCKEDDVVLVGAVIAVIETEDVAVAPVAEQGKAAPAADSQPAPIAQPQPAGFSDSQSGTIAGSRPESPAAERQPTATPENRPEHSAVTFASSQIPGMDHLPETVTPASDSSYAASERFYSPLVKNIAHQEQISPEELNGITGTGAEGRLTKDDLLNYLQNGRRDFSREIKTAVVTVVPPLPPPYANPDTAAAGSASAAGQSAASQSGSGTGQTVTDSASSAQAAANQSASATNPEVAATNHAAAANGADTASKSQPANASGSISGSDEIIEMDRMGKLISDHMVMSKHTSAHVTSFVEADVTSMVMWRERVKKNFEKRENEKITFTPIFLEAVSRAIKDFPMINVSVQGTKIILKKNINIGMAAALPSGNLIVPVIKNADQLNLLGLTKAVNDLAVRARASKLKPDETQGGTFTLTNVGSFGNIMGTPIINQPQVAILAVGAIKKKPAVLETEQGDVIAIRHMMFLSLSYDHRVVNGALGGTFVRRVADYLENWDINREI